MFDLLRCEINFSFSKCLKVERKRFLGFMVLVSDIYKKGFFVCEIQREEETKRRKEAREGVNAVRADGFDGDLTFFSKLFYCMFS